MNEEIRRHEEHLKVLLGEAGITVEGSPAELIGRRFMFACEHGSHSETVVGTITGINASDEFGLMLRVSEQHFFSCSLFGLRWSSKGEGWHALTKGRVGEGFRPFGGALQIY